MDFRSAPSRVLHAYPADCRSEQVEGLGGAGGFSGAEFWRVHAPRGALCLRRWPREHPAREGLDFIHLVLEYAARRGLNTIPLPIRTLAGTSWVFEHGHLWDLTPWLPGESSFEREPSREKVEAGLRALAEFHLATADYPASAGATGVAPGIQRRLEQLRHWLDGGLEELSEAIMDRDWPEFASRARSILNEARQTAPAVWGKLKEVASLAVPLQPCIRDIWHGHVLFIGSRVTGLVDFGSLEVDNVATDVARLLGSMAGDQTLWWNAGAAAYGTVRRLSPEETMLVRAYDLSTVVISGLNWVDWVFCQRRQFADRPAVIRRLDGIVERLRVLSRSRKDWLSR